MIALAQSVLSSMVPDVHFSRGIKQGQAFFVEEDSERVVTESEALEVVRSNLSLEQHHLCNAFHASMGWEELAYSYRVGFVVGWLGAWLSALALSNRLDA